MYRVIFYIYNCLVVSGENVTLSGADMALGWVGLVLIV